jgi:hypothetical protein
MMNPWSHTRCAPGVLLLLACHLPTFTFRSPPLHCTLTSPPHSIPLPSQQQQPTCVHWHTPRERRRGSQAPSSPGLPSAFCNGYAQGNTTPGSQPASESIDAARSPTATLTCGPVNTQAPHGSGSEPLISWSLPRPRRVSVDRMMVPYSTVLGNSRNYHESKLHTYRGPMCKVVWNAWWAPPRRARHVAATDSSSTCDSPAAGTVWRFANFPFSFLVRLISGRRQSWWRIF